MKVTISVIKADIGSIGGHICPRASLFKTVKDIGQKAGDLLCDSHISHGGDDIAILCTHNRGVGNDRVHNLAWEPGFKVKG